MKELEFPLSPNMHPAFSEKNVIVIIRLYRCDVVVSSFILIFVRRAVLFKLQNRNDIMVQILKKNVT